LVEITEKGETKTQLFAFDQLTPGSYPCREIGLGYRRSAHSLEASLMLGEIDRSDGASDCQHRDRI